MSRRHVPIYSRQDCVKRAAARLAAHLVPCVWCRGAGAYARKLCVACKGEKLVQRGALSALISLHPALKTLRAQAAVAERCNPDADPYSLRSAARYAFWIDVAVELCELADKTLEQPTKEARS